MLQWHVTFVLLSLSIHFHKHACSSSLPDWQTVYADPAKSFVIPLTGSQGPPWTLSYSDGNYSCNDADNSVQVGTATVPGDLWSDLLDNGLIQEPYAQRDLFDQRRVWLGPKANCGNNSSSYWEIRTRTWIYSTSVDLDFLTKNGDLDSSKQVENKNEPLYYASVIESVQMGADVFWNQQRIAFIGNQFYRHVVFIPSNIVQPINNKLSFVFRPGSGGKNLRFMACSGGWDWAPYTRAVQYCNKSNDAEWQGSGNLGIVRPLYLVATQTPFFVSHFQPLVSQASSTLQKETNNYTFTVEMYVTIHYFKVIEEKSMSPFYICGSIDIIDAEIFCQDVSKLNTTKGVYRFLLHTWFIEDHQIEHWWPYGMDGNQTLYTARLCFCRSLQCNSSSFYISNDNEYRCMEKQLGFRSVALITDFASYTDKNSADVISDNGSGLHGMRYTINEKHIWVRGANVVPVDLLARRWSDEKYRQLVRSAFRANMNMLRVWGGGTLLPQSFYDECDRLGILVQQDLYFIEEQFHGAYKSLSVANEIADFIQSLSHHPSIVQWNGCNECSESTFRVYESFVMPTITVYDNTRIIWATSPSEYGWESGVFTHNGHANGLPFRIRRKADANSHKIETHGPYQRGYSSTHPAVNGVVDPQAFQVTNVPPLLDLNLTTGVEYPSTLVSEFGATSYSSIESMSAYITNDDWNIHGSGPADTCYNLLGNVNACNGTNVWAERNYPCDSFIETYFGNVSLTNESSPFVLQRQLYECMMAQTLWMKGQIEKFRSMNTFGILIWQLNEIWPTGGWGLFEYDDFYQQQHRYKQERDITKKSVFNNFASPILHIHGGRWKPLAYLLQQYLYSDVLVACGQNLTCMVKNDGSINVVVNVTVEVWKLAALDDSNELLNTLTFQPIHVHGLGGKQVFQLADAPTNLADHQIYIIQTAIYKDKNYYKNAFLSLLKTQESVYLTVPPRAFMPVSSNLKPVITAKVLVDLSNPSTIWLRLTSTELVLYVWLSTAVPGHWHQNAIPVIRPNATTSLIQFDAKFANAPIDMDLFKRTLRVEHLQTYNIRDSNSNSSTHKSSHDDGIKIVMRTVTQSEINTLKVK